MILAQSTLKKKQIVTTRWPASSQIGILAYFLPLDSSTQRSFNKLSNLMLLTLRQKNTAEICVFFFVIDQLYCS